MGADLTKYECGNAFVGDYSAALAALQHRLAQLQIAQVAHKKRALIIFEGWVGAGKTSVLKRLAASWDPCRVSTRRVPTPLENLDDRHWLAPFWSALPPAGNTTVFFNSWYRRLVEDRLAGRTDDKRWTRACDEINEFEAQQRDHGTLVVKLFFHVSADVHEARLEALAADPWRRHLYTAEELDGAARRERTMPILHDLLAQTDTRWAPWQIINSNDKYAARIATLEALVHVMTKALPAEPPVESAEIVDFPMLRSTQRSA
jgi:polyphosphate kinase 2 (PPK2 family)